MTVGTVLLLLHWEKFYVIVFTKGVNPSLNLLRNFSTINRSRWLLLRYSIWEISGWYFFKWQGFNLSMLMNSLPMGRIRRKYLRSWRRCWSSCWHVMMSRASVMVWGRILSKEHHMIRCEWRSDRFVLFYIVIIEVQWISRRLSKILSCGYYALHHLQLLHLSGC